MGQNSTQNPQPLHRSSATVTKPLGITVFPSWAFSSARKVPKWRFSTIGGKNLLAALTRLRTALESASDVLEALGRPDLIINSLFSPRQASSAAAPAGCRYGEPAPNPARARHLRRPGESSPLPENRQVADHHGGYGQVRWTHPAGIPSVARIEYVNEITAADVRAAAARIRPLAKRTPVLASTAFDAAAGTQAFFKCENLQTGGAFKIRGASNLIFSIPPADLPRGVIGYSSGNHALAVAIAARHVGAAATIVMPADAPRSKMDTTRELGARIVTYDRVRDSREAIAAGILKETGATLVPPFDHPLIMAGQGTAALELLEDAPALDALIAPVGGGGLLSGCAIAARDRNPAIRIFGVEPEDGNDTFLSFLAGERVAIPPPNSIADGLRSPKPGELTFPVLKRLAERIILVSDEELRSTVKFLLTRLKVLVEPSGAAAAAAVLHGKLPKDIRTVGIVLSGGNVDFEQLAAY